MTKFKIIIDPKAEKQIEGIVDYIAFQLCNKQAALLFLNSMEKSINNLAFMPDSHSLVDREPWRSKGIRKVFVKSFVVYYFVNKDSNYVYIMAVIYNQRDQFKQLNKLDFD